MSPFRSEFRAPAVARIPLLILALALPAATASKGPAAATASIAELLNEGERALEARDWAAAERTFRRAVALAPKSARAHSDLAAVLGLAGKSSAEAIAEARRATELAPAEVAYLVRYGATLETAGRLADARAVLRKARDRRPSDPQILMLLADCSVRLQDEEAAPLLRQVISASPDNRLARTMLANFLWSRDDAAGGDAVMDDALRAFPRDAEMHAAYARSLLQRLQFTRAIEHFSRARELGRNSASLLNALGESCWEAGRLEEALGAFEASIAADPDFFPSRLGLGRLLLRMGRPSEAARALKDAVRAKGDSAPAQWNLGRALVDTGDPDGAEKAFRQAVERQPEVSRYRYSLSTLLRQRRDPGADAELARFQAAYDAEQRAEYEASSRRVDLNGAIDLLRRGEVDEALKRFRELPESAASLEGEAESLGRLGRHAEAIRALEKASSLAPEDVAIRAALAREYAETQEK